MLIKLLYVCSFTVIIKSGQLYSLSNTDNVILCLEALSHEQLKASICFVMSVCLSTLSAQLPVDTFS